MELEFSKEITCKKNVLPKHYIKVTDKKMIFEKL